MVALKILPRLLAESIASACRALVLRARAGGWEIVAPQGSLRYALRVGTAPTRALCLVLILLCTGCGSPQRWSQFHADGPNTGFVPAGTSYALRPAWEATVGGVLFSSPVLDAEGNLYVGNADGFLVSVSPSGSVRWRSSMPGGGPILASPAVDSSGRIYVVVTQEVDGETFRSTLHCVRGTTGGVLWTRELPEGEFTTASPKTRRGVLGDEVLLHVQRGAGSFLLVFDGEGRQLSRHGVVNSCPITASSGIGDFLSDLWDFITNYDGTFDPSGIPIYENFGWPTPTLAVVEEGTAADGAPMVVAAAQCGVYGYRWTGTAFEYRWGHNFEDGRLWSSPAVVGSAVVIGSDDGRVRAWDLISGAALWDYNLGGSDYLLATPATNGRDVFLVSAEHLTVLDSVNGALLHQGRLADWSLASPAVSARHVFVNTRVELTTYSFGLGNRAHEAHSDGGLSSPAIGPDGTVYVVAGGRLRAYPRR